MAGVLAREGKVLDDLAAMGYKVAELADWVGPTSAEFAQAAPQAAHGTLEGAQGGAQVAEGSLQQLAGLAGGPERLAVTQDTPPPGQVRSSGLGQPAQAQAQPAQATSSTSEVPQA